MHCEEFRAKNPSLHEPTLSGMEPPLAIDEVHSEAELQALFRHIEDTWQRFGLTEPYWSVVISERFKTSNVEAAKETFYESGRWDRERLYRTLARNGIDRRSLKSCLEYGCGLGRITRWLAEDFEHVFGYDVSRPHLQTAERYLSERSVRNVTLCHIEKVQDLETLPRVDLIYSIIVLQHNPPPLIKIIIRALINALNPRGIAYFQVPTYRLGYEFSLDSYLKNEASKHDVEMHCLSQHHVFDIVRGEGGKMVEVIEDGCTGSRYKEVSNTFVIQKAY